MQVGQRLCLFLLICVQIAKISEQLGQTTLNQPAGRLHAGSKGRVVLLPFLHQTH